MSGKIPCLEFEETEMELDEEVRDRERREKRVMTDGMEQGLRPADQVTGR
jgi:hypothetical protein